jgi:hypothetical protein
VQAWEILRSMGVLTESQSFHAVLRRQGQGSTAELVDSYGVSCRPVRDVLVRYLDHKRPALDYNSFRNLVTVLVGLFWVDIEHHHPGIDSLHLPAEVAEAWKQRLRMVVSRRGRVKPRRFYLTRLVGKFRPSAATTPMSGWRARRSRIYFNDSTTGKAATR